ncbi:adenylate/guanylate cyclase domain-containing protein [Bradyrhizobium sp. 186]|uniref:adenylate/guanylate cyclase domain-containing protein n=1 Tax=Bradyrhizobium sp. 186 TaxID=2782654 RepID=UPI0020007E2C|nr:adenylate/guanylate cyclase domain-containing protein [Bradyrhizobium sp. 186]UPK40602.1 adenylate/guanylate cyclase domain-containing protein [Bradyrhizobium sp. 186]
MQPQRRLAAILVADVVGYSRLMGQDERGTLRRIKAIRREVVDPNIAAYHGRIVKTTGDGMLIEYPSAVEAVGCAVAVQRAMAERNADIPVDQRIEFRVGVHQGDIVVDDQDIFGDGVNVAARLEPLSAPGGFCISARVYEDMAGRLELPFEDRGEQQLKNIARPVRIYALGPKAIAGLPATPDVASEDSRNNGLALWLGQLLTPTLPTKSLRWLVLLPVVVALAGIGAWQVTKRSQAPPRLEAANQSRGPTIAVLPFDNLSGDPSQEFFSDGISEELITRLSRFDHLRVLARNTTFAYKKAIEMQELSRQLQAQYVIEGSFRRIPDQISVTAQLIDARTGTHLWAQTYERSTASASLLSLQNDIAHHIGAAIGDIRTGAIAKAVLERARSKPATELSSYECVLQGYQASAAQSAAGPMRRARACLEATVTRDPTYAEAWAILTRILYIQRSWGTGLDDVDKRVDLVPRLLEAGNRAVELAPENAAAHFALFSAYAATCQTKRMRVEADRVLAINPNDASALGLIGNLLAYAGDWDYGRQLAEKALALAGPAAPSWWWWVIAKDYYRKGEYAKALEVFQRSYAEQNWLDHLHLVYTLPHLGRVDEARAQVPSLMKLKPDISVREADRYYTMWCFDADFRDRMVRALRLAGLREEADENRLRRGNAAVVPSQP